MDEARILSAPRFVGQSIGRKENQRFLTGNGQFVDDIILPGMLHAAIYRSPIARAKIVSIDVTAARDLPGVQAVYTAAEMNGQFKPLTYIFGGTEPGGITVVLAEGEASYVGDPIAIVVADDRYIAEDALEMIEVDYEPIEPLVSIDQARTGMVALSGRSSNFAFSLERALPGAAEAFAEAAHVVPGVISHGRIAPTPMETRGIICDPRKPGLLDIHMTSQNPHQAKAYLADMLGMAEPDIRIISPDVGGAFGQKYCFGRDLLSVVGASRLLKRPVKWIEDRSEALQAGGHGRTDQLALDIAIDADGRFLATKLRYEDIIGADPMVTPSGNGQLAMLFHTGAYNIPTMSADLKIWFSNTCGSIPYRGPWAGETLVREATVDKAARQLGIDPLELRRRNIFTQQPHTLPLGVRVEGVTPRETLDKATDMLGYAAFRAEQAQARDKGRYLGCGISLCLEPTAISAGGNSSDIAQIRLEVSGKVTAVVTGHSQGHSIETTLAQIVADEVGVGMDDVRIVCGDTNSIGYGAGAGGSRQAVVSGGAVKIASGMLRDKTLAVASHLLQLPVADLRIENGHVRGKGVSGPSISLAQIGLIAYRDPNSLPAGLEAGLQASYRYAPEKFTFSNACHVCTVEVDIDTGIVKILRYIVAGDCGVLLNPAVVEGQVSGGVIQALGLVLWEELHYDDYGNPSASTFKDYGMPLCTDVPRIEQAHLCTPSNTPTGAKGVGEGGTIAGAPAIYNAVMDALSPFGVCIEQLPLSPARIVAAIHAAKKA